MSMQNQFFLTRSVNSALSISLSLTAQNLCAIMNIVHLYHQYMTEYSYNG